MFGQCPVPILTQMSEYTHVANLVYGCLRSLNAKTGTLYNRFKEFAALNS